MSTHHYTYPKVIPVPRPGPLPTATVSGTTSPRSGTTSQRPRAPRDPQRKLPAARAA